ncbi:MAG: hypothetical protein GY904_08840 [Planctomycetaceae bacterium]|nr:hypothetical protein [Planctomycetaceae bacterium]
MNRVSVSSSLLNWVRIATHNLPDGYRNGRIECVSTGGVVTTRGNG